tara:strand:+ start:1203 stop:5087 length:3885 start_codon:yes stop_codon:yes gene_type:complete
MGKKSTLVGESFSPWVNKQVEARQKMLGRVGDALYTNDQLRYINSKTSFLRLTSGVDITNEEGPSNTTRLKDLGLSESFLSNQLARHFVLEGGTSTFLETGSIQRRGGLVENLKTENTSLNSKGAYGMSSSDKYGYTPMPGLISADIKSLNRGSLKEATVKIKCYNPQQFDIIDTLFIKLKYGMLLEWGHSIYVDNEGEIQNNNYSLSDEFLGTVETPLAENPTTGMDIFEMAEAMFNQFNSLGKKNKQTEIYNTIVKYREESNGNYDAILAFVKNFNWTLNSDNSYDITLELISIGDVIESLRMDVSLGGSKLNVKYNGSDVAPSALSTYDMPLMKNANRSIMDQIFAGIFTATELADDAQNSWVDASWIVIPVLSSILDDPTNSIFASFPPALKKGLKEKVRDGAYSEVLRIEFDESSEHSEESYYLKLGTLLRIIEQAFIPRNKEDNDPMFKINNTFKTKMEGQELSDSSVLDPYPPYLREILLNNLNQDPADEYNRIALCYTLPSQMSLDPSVCLIPLPEDTGTIRDFLETDIIEKIKSADKTLTTAEARRELEENAESGNWFTGGFGDDYGNIKEMFVAAAATAKSFNGKLGHKFRREDNDYIGNMNHIHVNMAYVSTLFTKLSTSDDKSTYINVYDFLTKIMDGIGKALGGVNDFEVVYDSDDNFFYIIDNTALPGAGDISESVDDEPVEFLINLNDRVGGRGSFVTNTSIKSEISSELAAEISIAAVSNESSVNAGSTRFKWLNYGTKNRILQASEISNPGSSANTDNSGDDIKDLVGGFSETIINYIEYISEISTLNFDYEDLETYQSSLSSVFSLASQNIEKSYATDPDKTGTQSKGFIPINLSLDLDGLSGPKIFEKFKIPDEFLPSSYKGNVNFLIKEISHTISSGKWSTSYGTLCVPSTSKEKRGRILTAAELAARANFLDSFGETRGSSPSEGNASSSENASRGRSASGGKSPSGEYIPLGAKDANSPINHDDYQSITSGLPHGRPPYNVRGYQYAVGGGGEGAGDGHKIFYAGTRRAKASTGYETGYGTPKTQIFLHHTAGWPKAGAEGTIGTAEGWSDGEGHVSTHVVIAGDGYTDYLYTDDYIGWHTGKGFNWRSLGIEVKALGHCYTALTTGKNPDGTRNSRIIKGEIITSAGKRPLPLWDGASNGGYTTAVDKWGNDAIYKDHEYYQAYTQAQVDATMGVVLNWMNKHNIPFTYNYDFLFPPKSGPLLDYSFGQFQGGAHGVYTHNSVKATKSDIFPQYSMVAALRKLALQVKGREGCYGDTTDYGPQYPNGYDNF